MDFIFQPDFCSHNLEALLSALSDFTATLEQRERGGNPGQAARTGSVTLLSNQHHRQPGNPACEVKALFI